MKKKKICMLGGYGVGKTSLVRNFVHSIFTEKYHITIGVKIDKKTVVVNNQEIMLMLWDIAGEEDNFTIPLSYLKGSDGYLLVIDGTRERTCGQAADIQERVQKSFGALPFVVCINKSDLKDDWEIDESALEAMRSKEWLIIESSAKTGKGVEKAFTELARRVCSDS